MSKPEILAPAGSYEALLAAIHNGCDAVYLGGKAYGARAYAKNFDIESLRRGVSYANKYRVKVYYTINTLFKEKEVEGLLNHIEEVVKAGVHGLIIQDLGVAKILKQMFPQIELHGSTQINCHSLEGVQFLDTIGFCRVVLARELNLEEITYIQRNTSVALETFVHGALCYCYSGQCLMSSFLGGRSGNRGRCAQPCRLAYKGRFEDGLTDSTHLLSPKDIESLTLLPEIITTGVASLKIEGRMKSPEYVGLMTALYKKYRDLFLSGAPYKVRQKDIEDMCQIFNRGNFSKGYYTKHNGPDMITFTQSKNQGRVIGEVIKVQGNLMSIHSHLPLEAGDCLEVQRSDGSYYSFILKQSVQHEVNVSVSGIIVKGTKVRRIKSMALMSRLQEQNKVIPVKRISLTGIFNKGEPAKLIISDGLKSITVKGEIVQEARNQSITGERLIKQLSKVGDYPVTINKIDLQVDKDIFMPISQINQLRRSALDQWLNIDENTRVESHLFNFKKVINTPTSSEKNITVLLRNWHQFETVIMYAIKRIYLEWVNFTSEEIKEIITWSNYQEPCVEIWLAVPKVLRYEKTIELAQLKSDVPTEVKGFLLRSIEGYQFVSQFNKKVQWDYSLNIMNQWAYEVFKGFKCTSGFVPSMELKLGELKGLELSFAEVILYGHINVMTSAQCIVKSLKGCHPNQGHLMAIKDRKDIDVPVETNCLLCYNNLYNGLPLYLIDRIECYQQLGVKDYRLEFLNESKTQIQKVMNAAINDHSINPKGILKTYTRGHYNKGVE